MKSKVWPIAHVGKLYSIYVTFQILEYVQMCYRLYQQQGSPEAGASALDKAAKIIEHTHPEMALNLYQHAVEVVMERFVFFI